MAILSEHLLLDLVFGRGGNGLPFLKHGWCGPKANFTWTQGHVSEIEFSAPAPGRQVLCLDMTSLGRQRLSLCINGAERRSYVFEGMCSVTLPIDIPAQAGAARVHIRFETPDADSPARLFGETDTQILAFALARLRLLRRATPLAIWPPMEQADLQASTGLARAELMLNFESLGHNCEFGIVQRMCGAEPMGLLRFAGISMADLMRGLHSDFEGLGNLDKIKHVFWQQTANPEYVIHEQGYNLHYHSGVARNDLAPEALYQRESTRLSFYRRKFLEDLQSGDKILVFQWPHTLMTGEIEPLLTLLRAKGDNRLLWVIASPEHAPGTVERLSDHLLRGYIDHFAPLGDVPGGVDLAPWLSVSANAFRALTRRSDRYRPHQEASTSFLKKRSKKLLPF